MHVVAVNTDILGPLSEFSKSIQYILVSGDYSHHGWRCRKQKKKLIDKMVVGVTRSDRVRNADVRETVNQDEDQERNGLTVSSNI